MSPRYLYFRIPDDPGHEIDTAVQRLRTLIRKRESTDPVVRVSSGQEFVMRRDLEEFLVSTGESDGKAKILSGKLMGVLTRAARKSSGRQLELLIICGQCNKLIDDCDCLYEEGKAFTRHKISTQSLLQCRGTIVEDTEIRLLGVKLKKTLLAWIDQL